MRHFRAVCLAILTLTGACMPAQENTAPEGIVPILEEMDTVERSTSSSEFLYLKDGEIRCDSKDKDRLLLKHTYNGRDYRKMSKSEAARLDAMPKVDVRRHDLYFDGRRIKTNSWRVYEVYSAHYWSGGVILAAHTSKGRYSFPEVRNELGFIDLRTSTCRFSRFSWRAFKKPPIPEFLAPVTMGTSGLVLDVRMPEKVYGNEKFDRVVSVTNVSDRPVLVPDSLAEGLGVVQIEYLAEPSEYARKLYGGDIWPHPRKWPAHPDPPDCTLSPLAPGERRDAAVPFGLLRLRNRSRLVFYWDALLDPADRGRMTRLTCEKWLDFAEPAMDTSRRELALDVRVLGKVPAEGKFDATVSLTNMSKRTVLVPNDLGDGLGVARMYPAMLRMRDGTAHDARRLPTEERERLLAAGAEDVYRPHLTIRGPAIHFPYDAHCSPLAPSATRETTISLDAQSLHLGLDRHLLEFFWDGLMDPDDRGRVSRFTAPEVWVEVTE